MIPEFLSEFRSEIEKYKLETIRISATPLRKKELLPLRQSKFLGHPYLPVGIPFPRDKKNSPMIMLAQLNFEEMPSLENYPSSGILQFYIAAKEWYNMEEYTVLFHEDATIEAQTDFSFLTNDLYEESPISLEHELKFSKETEFGGTADSRFDLTFNGKSYYDFCETVTKSQQEELHKLFYNTGHKVGGYAYFTQGDPRDYDKGKLNDVLLLQIDSEGEIMFGDSGVANFFISPNDLRDKNFGKAYFNWDCL